MNDNAAVAAILSLGVTGVLLGLAVVLVPMILYFLTLQRVMNKVSPANKPFAGELIWLGLIPGLGPIWHLVYIVLLSSAIQKDYTAVGQTNNGAMPIAIGSIVSMVLCIIPVINVLAAIAAFVLWIIYWVKMAEYNRQLPLTR